MATHTLNQAGEKTGQLPRARGRFISHVLMLVTGNGVAQAISLIGTLLLARLFAPGAFGFFALFAAIVSFVSVIGGGRYELAIMLPEQDSEAASIFALSLFVLLGMSAGSAVIVLLLRVPIARLLGDARMGVWLWGIPAAAFIRGLYLVLECWSGRMKRFQRVAIARVCLSAGTIAGQFVLLMVSVNAGLALVGGWIFGQLLGTSFFLGQTFGSEGRYLFHAYTWRGMREALRKYKNFPIYRAPYSFIVNASARLVLVVLGMFTSLDVVGLYSMASRAVYLPTGLVASSMNQVFYEKAATELRSGRLEQFVTRILRILVVLATPLLILFAFYAKLLFQSVLGEKWAAAGVYAAILAFAGYSYFIVSWLDRLFDVRGRQRLSLILEVAGKAISLGGLVLVLWFTRDIMLAVGTFAALETVYTGVWLAFAYQIAGFKVSSLVLLMKDILVSGLIALLIIGSFRAVVHSSWAAFGLSMVAVALIDAVFFTRYVSGGRAYSSTAERFRRFWADKPSALNHSETTDFYRAHAEELKRLFAPVSAGRVLEIGCGDGTLFPYLDVPTTRYKGIDFCPHFIDRFRRRYPAADLQCAEGASYLDSGQKYDLILVNLVIQHFDRRMLKIHLQNARAMMHQDSFLLWGSIPNKACRTHYDFGVWSEAEEPSALRWIKSCCYRFVGLDQMGYWYRPEDLGDLAEGFGLDAQFIQSTTYPYRFHTVLRLKPAQSVRSESFD